MLRVGNNSASCLIRPNGEITDCLIKKKLPNGKTVVAPELRGRASGIFTIMLELEPEPTFYTRFGNLFIALCWVLSVAGTIIASLVWYRKKTQLLKVTGKVTEK